MDKIRNYIVMDNKDNIHEYNIKVETNEKGDIYTLSTSNSGVWTENYKGKVVQVMTDNGSDVVFNKALGKTIDYGVIDEIKLLLNFRNHVDGYATSKYKIVEETAIILM